MATVASNPSAPPPYSVVDPSQQQSVQITRPPQELALVLRDLINQAHMPDVAEVSESQKREMALKMRSLREILVDCEAAKPKLFSDVKRFSHPSLLFKGKCEIKNLFEVLTQVANTVKAIRGGLELSHIGDGFRIIRYFSLKVIPVATGSKKYIDSLNHYSSELRNITREHWAKIWRDSASYGIGEIYKERVDMVFRAIDANQLMVEEALTPEYLEAEKKEQDRCRAAMPGLQAELNRAMQGSAAAYAQVYNGMRPPAQVSSIVPNPNWTPSNGAAYIAYRAPNGAIRSAY